MSAGCGHQDVRPGEVITEEQRHRLFQALEEVLGHEPTVTLMEHLPPVGWADVATKRDLDQHAAASKRDLDHVETILRGEIKRVETELESKIESTSDRLRAELARDLRGYGLAVITVNASITAMAIGLSQLL